jgi:hypothetical protein
MRRYLLVAILVAATDAAAYTVVRQAAPPPSPPATAGDLMKAEKLADRMERRLELHPRKAGSSWRHGSPGSR